MRISHIIAVALTILLTNGALWIRFRVKTDHLQVRMSDLQTQALESKRFIDNFCSSVTLIGRKLDAILESRPGDFERILSAEEPRQLVLVFSKENCMACVMSQLRVFSKIQELAADRKSIRVIGITDGPRAWINRLIRIFGQRFPIYSDVNFSASLPDNILPLVTLIDKRRSILAAYRPIPGKSHFSLVFYGTIQGKLDLPSPLFDFKDVKPSDIVTQRMKLSDYSDFVY